ncbi:MAG TPA: nicotinate phosphoribosyltransferase [Dehalococcoidia bacterium]|nr:nicotinate phosphoribosyltransferase [Dehalococcoidia bacterium]
MTDHSEARSTEALTNSLLIPSILDGETSDVYFIRAREVLQSEGINPSVTIEFFPSGNGVLCGIREALGLLEHVLPGGCEVWAMPERAEFVRKQVALRVTAPYLSFGIYETAILGALAHESGWATAARTCVQAAGGVPVSSFGARHVHPLVAARMDYAAVTGGCDSCSSVLGARLAGVQAAESMPHALILIMGDTATTALAFDRIVDKGIPRIALVDTYHDEAEEAVAVADALAEAGRRLDGVRLDTPSERGGVTPDLVKEVRARLDLAGHAGVKIVVSGGITPERMAQFRGAGAPIDFYGVGSFIAGAAPIDFTADIKAIEGRSVAKRGRIPGITPDPALVRVV